MIKLRSVRLYSEGVPNLIMYEDGTIIDTLTNRVLPLKKHAVNPAVEYYQSSTGKTIYLCIQKLIRRYFKNELLEINERDRLNLNFMGLSKYSVTRDGRIWSHIKEDWLTVTNKNSHGYVSLNLHSDGSEKPKAVKLHRLIAIAFVANPNGYDCVDHLDGNKLNNSASNLEWVSAEENNRRARRSGLKPQAVTDEEIHLICQMLVDGYSDTEIACEANTYAQIVNHIRHGHIHRRISSLYGIKPNDVVRNTPIDWSKYTKHWSKYKTYTPKQE